MKKLLTNKLFMAVFASNMLSSFGDVMYYLALMAYVLQLPDAKLGISIVGLSEALPYLTGFIMGYWADKTVHKVKTIIQTLLFRVGLYVIVGIVIGFQPSLWVVVVVAFINVLSDLAGQYEDGLYTPLSLRIVSNEDRADSFAFRQTARSLFSIGFQT
ncbi:MFS transporter, partial [Escherichia coli]|nr:MFS transporter [Escherichia coli]